MPSQTGFLTLLRPFAHNRLLGQLTIPSVSSDPRPIPLSSSSGSEDTSEPSPKKLNKTKVGSKTRVLLGLSWHGDLSSSPSFSEKEEGELSENAREIKALRKYPHRLCPLDLCLRLMYKAAKTIDLEAAKSDCESPRGNHIPLSPSITPTMQVEGLGKTLPFYVSPPYNKGGSSRPGTMHSSAITAHCGCGAV